MARNQTNLTLVLQILVLTNIVLSNKDIKNQLRKDREEYFKNKTDQCNKEVLKLYLEADVKPNDDIHQICVSVTTPCCSLADIEIYTRKISASSSTLKELSDWMKYFYGYIQIIPDDSINKTAGISTIDTFKQELKNAPHGQAEVSLYLDAVSMVVIGLGCVICDAKHGSDFTFNNGKLETLQVQPAQCRQQLTTNFKLFRALRHLYVLGKEAKGISVANKMQFDFNIEQFNDQITKDEKQVDECLREFNKESKDASTSISAPCLALCKNYTYLVEYKVPYNFQTLANDILKIFIIVFDMQPKEFQPVAMDPTFATHAFKDKFQDYNIKLDPLGIDVTTHILDPEFSKLDSTLDPINIPTVEKTANVVNESDDSSSIGIIGPLILVLGVLGGAAGIVYYKSK